VPIHVEKQPRSGDEVLEHAVLITIDRPETRNALDIYHFRDLANAWMDFRDDDDLWLAIVTGVPGAFMAGADLKTYIPQITELMKEIGKGEVSEIDGCRLTDGMTAVLRDVDVYKPIIAAVDGPCVAGGMEMLGGVDIRIATPEATFGVMEPKRGLFAGGGTTARLPRQIPFPAAMEFLLTAERFPAERALALGLLNEIVSSEEGPAHPGQRAAGRAGHQGVGHPWGGGDPRGGLPHRGRAVPADLLHRGRQGGPEGLRREARARMEGHLDVRRPAGRDRPR
jgi:enoyl-CoA hydratase